MRRIYPLFCRFSSDGWHTRRCSPRNRQFFFHKTVDNADNNHQYVVPVGSPTLLIGWRWFSWALESRRENPLTEELHACKEEGREEKETLIREHPQALWAPRGSTFAGPFLLPKQNNFPARRRKRNSLLYVRRVTC